MKPLASGYRQSNHSPMTLKLTVAALASAGILSSASVWAQDAQSVADKAQAAQPINSVVVTGVRRAAQSAQTIKKNSDEVVDSIVADEAGKFPDKNVAEVLGRVTGVQMLRGGGEANQVIIRGLPGLVTLLNGREVYTSRDRNVYLADIPTTMLQRVDVYKTQGAEMVEGGTAGVIDVRTARPFDFKGFSSSVMGRVENRDKANTNDPQLSGMVSNRWKTSMGEFGALLGLSYQKGHYHDEVTWNSQPATNLAPADPSVQSPFDLGHVNHQGERKRLSANWALQYRPSNTLELYAEGWSTRIDHNMEHQFFLGGMGWNPNTTYTLFPGTKQVDSFTSQNPFVLSSNQTPREESDSDQGAIGARWNATPDLRITTEFARTRSHWSQEFPIMEMLAHPPTVTGNTYKNGGAYWNYPGYDMMNPANYTLFNFIDNWADARGSSNDWRADATYTLDEDSFFKDVSAGVRLAQRHAAYFHESGNFLPAPAGLPSVTSLAGATCPSMPLANDYGMNQWLVICDDYQHANIDAWRKMYGRNGKTDPDPYSLFSNQEDTTAFYGKTRFGFKAGPVPIDGTFGVRIVKTELDVNGYSNVNGKPVAVNRKTSDTDVLPNLTLKAALSDKVIGRFNIGKAIQRPNFQDFNPGESLGATPDGQGIYGGAGGNPDLKPVSSTNMDVALEYYFAPTGNVTATVFKHDFKNYVISATELETIGGKQYRMVRPRNVNEGQLKGVEIGYRQFYDFLPGWLSGFGLEANYTYMKGYFLDKGVESPFRGTSKYAYNIVGLYEKGPYSARLAYNYRSRFVDEYNYRTLPAPVGPLNLIVDPIKTMDASFSYKLTENLGITLDVENLLDRTYHDYHGVPNQPRDIRRYDRVIGLSLRWKM
ncbi:MAG: TonB-dependent receptor [Gammaproteobacteria bacterium]